MYIFYVKYIFTVYFMIYMSYEVIYNNDLNLNWNEGFNTI